jgi:hypothetical protein
VPVIRKVYSTGSAVVIGLPVAYRDLTGLEPGVDVVLEVTTPKQLLEALGVAPATIAVMDLPEEHFIIVRKHEPG